MISAIRHKIPISNPVLFRLAVLAGLIVGLLGIGYVASRVSPELVLIAVVAPPVVLLALSRLEYGVLAIVPTAASNMVYWPSYQLQLLSVSLCPPALKAASWPACL